MSAVATTPPQPPTRVYDLKIESRRPKLTKEQLIEKVMGGEICLVAEYRSTKFDEVRYLDKKTGKPERFIKVEHHVEAVMEGQTEAFSVEERQPRDLDSIQAVHLGLVKGQIVVLRLMSVRREQGRLIASVDGLNGVAVLV